MFFLSTTLGPIYTIYQFTTPSSLRSQVYALHVLVAGMGLGTGPLVIGWLNEAVFAERGRLALQSSFWVLALAALAASLCFAVAARFLREDTQVTDVHPARYGV